MIIGFGSDLCSADRIEKLLAEFGDRFLNRCFTKHEQAYAYAAEPTIRVARLAKRFAAKEACAKALGCGIGGKAALTDIEIRNDAQGRPEIFLSGAAESTLLSLLPTHTQAKLHVSLSDENGLALAQVIMEAVPDNKGQANG